jgi:dissimilatory sulfite reductase (desulfoviridin) alpha/beta subunit
VRVCPTGATSEGTKGYRVLLGGKLSRHPQFAKELPDIHDEDQILQIIHVCLDFYTQHSKYGERFGRILSTAVFEDLTARFERKSKRSVLI